MAGLTDRIAIAERALASLREIDIRPGSSPRDRDAAIIRFIYTFESVWKATQRFLSEREGLDARTPKSVIRGAFEAALLTAGQTEQALIAANDRNLAVHTYNETLAIQLLARLPGHVAVLAELLSAMRERVGGYESAGDGPAA